MAMHAAPDSWSGNRSTHQPYQPSRNELILHTNTNTQVQVLIQVEAWQYGLLQANNLQHSV